MEHKAMTELSQFLMEKEPMTDKTEIIARAMRRAIGDWDETDVVFECRAQTIIQSLKDAGYRVVPEEPTEAMLEAEMQRRGIDKHRLMWAHYILEARAIYKAMTAGEVT